MNRVKTHLTISTQCHPKECKPQWCQTIPNMEINHHKNNNSILMIKNHIKISINCQKKFNTKDNSKDSNNNNTRY